MSEEMKALQAQLAELQSQLESVKGAVKKGDSIKRLNPLERQKRLAIKNKETTARVLAANKLRALREKTIANDDPRAIEAQKQIEIEQTAGVTDAVIEMAEKEINSLNAKAVKIKREIEAGRSNTGDQKRYDNIMEVVKEKQCELKELKDKQAKELAELKNKQAKELDEAKSKKAAEKTAKETKDASK